MALLEIAGGVALILFGVRFLRKGLDRLLGYGLHAWLDRMSQSTATAAVTGACVGTVAPSSTAQTLLTLQLLKSGKLSIESALVFLLAANAGITVTVQLIALRVFDLYGAFLVVGLAGFQLLRSETLRGAAQAVLALGFVFLAMKLISGSAHDLTTQPAFTTILGLLGNQPIIVVLFAAIFTVACQSSTATLGLALGLAESGRVPLTLLLPVVLGANLGIGLTSLIAGYSTREGRGLGLANVGLKTLIVVIALASLPALTSFVATTPGDDARHAANFHSAFALVAVGIGYVAARPLGRLVEGWRARATEDAAHLGSPATHLDPEALATPRFALAHAARETLRMADEVKSMLENAWLAVGTANLDLARSVRQHDDRVDEIHADLKQYLSQLAPEAMDARDHHLQFGLLNFASQLEVVGDTIEKSLCGAAEKMAERPVQIRDADRVALNAFYERVKQRIETATAVLATRDRDLAREFLAGSHPLKEEYIAVQKAHYQRFNASDKPATQEASARFLDILNALRRIAGLVNTIGHTFVLEPRAGDHAAPVPTTSEASSDALNPTNVPAAPADRRPGTAPT